MTDDAGERPTRRRLDRITAEGYLDDVDGLDLGGVRARRDECAAEETQLSYLRRMLQARLDIVRAEQERRREGGEGRSIVDALPGLLADAPTGVPREARSMSIDPPEHQMRRHEDRAAVDGTLARLPDLSDDEVEELATTLVREEARVSATRRAVQHHLDQLQGELVQRYRRGEGDFAGISSEGGDGPSDDDDG